MRLTCSRFKRLGMPADRFIAHGSRAGQLAECGIDATGIATTVQRLVEMDETVDRAIPDLERTSLLSR